MGVYVKLVSCNSCGVVFDQDKIQFPNEEDYEDLTDGPFAWVGEYYAPYVDCPVCKEGRIVDEDA